MTDHPDTPRVGFVSLGCPKATVDSERILTQLRAEGYAISPSYDDADLVIVNTCGFIDAAVDESLEAIGEAVSEHGRVIVTGCLGARADLVRDAHPQVLAVTGPHAYAEVMAAVHAELPAPHDPFVSLVPPQGVKLTPRHYAYLKISEGCNHRCSFCIIPSLRGDLASRPIGDVMSEAQRLVAAGVRELLVVSQDTSAFGLDLRYRTDFWEGRPLRTDIETLARSMGELQAWVRLHYVYPYPHVDALIPLMAEGRILPYLDMPLQHASPAILKAMRRPAAGEKVLERLGRWREVCPELVMRSTFIVGFPGETRGRLRDPARLPARGASRPRGLLRLLARVRCCRERVAESGSGGREGGAPGAVHGGSGRDQPREACRPHRSAPDRFGGRGGGRSGDRPQLCRRAGDRRKRHGTGRLGPGGGGFHRGGGHGRRGP